MQKLLIVACAVLCLSPAMAQLPEGALAPKVKTTALNGQPVDLGAWLDANKIVVVEVMATWCKPCWNYHNSDALQSLYRTYGPDGLDRLRVLRIEGDPNTNRDCLLGLPTCNKDTWGNFTEGTAFPIADDAAAADSFKAKYYPLLQLICPNRKIYEINTWDANMIWDRAKSCPVAKGENNAGIFDYDPGTNVVERCEDTTALAPAFTLINLGSKPLLSAQLNLKWEGTLIQTIPWSGALGTYESARIQFAPLRNAGAGILETNVSAVNGGTDADPSNNTKTTAFKSAPVVNTPKAVLRLRTDGYGYETYWELRDEKGAVLKKGGNTTVGPLRGGLPIAAPNAPGTYPNNTLVRDTLLLPGPGLYSLHFSDAFGDGICCEYGEGYYRLYAFDNPVVPILTGGVFGSYDRRGFQIKQTGGVPTFEAETVPISLFPNPAHTHLWINLPPEQPSPDALNIFDAMGRLVVVPNAPPAANGSIRLDVSSLDPGIYVVWLQWGVKRAARRFVIGRK